MENIQSIIEKYQTEKAKIESDIQTLEREIIIGEERINQMKENLLKTYNTDNEEELLAIASNLKKEISDLEEKIS